MARNAAVSGVSCISPLTVKHMKSSALTCRVVIGFALRFNPLLVVVVTGLATGLLVGMDFGMLLETFGEKFVKSRSLATFILILPDIGLLEYYGLKERAQAWVAKIASATSARILMLYLLRVKPRPRWG
ncbi:Predicted membrane protein (plasmid) [Klebsiella pneumoniae]|nr:Predicted membrane protein [Klebsiella pneumoniae]